MSLLPRLVTVPALTLIGLALSGCGGTTSPTSAQPAATNPLLAALPANLEVAMTTNVASTIIPGTNQVVFLNGNLAVQGSSVSGIFRFSPGSTPTCVSPTQDIPFTGSLNSGNLLTLTTSSFAGTVAVITLQLPITLTPTATYTATATAQLTGGVCASTITQTNAFFVPPVAGTFIGNLTPSTFPGTPPTGTGGPATIVLTQASANADGQFPLTGTLNFTGTNCTLATSVSGYVSGLTVQLSSGTSVGTIGVAAVQFFGGAFSPGLSASTMNVTVPVQTCSNTGLYTGSLTRQ